MLSYLNSAHIIEKNAAFCGIPYKESKKLMWNAPPVICNHCYKAHERMEIFKDPSYAFYGTVLGSLLNFNSML